MPEETARAIDADGYLHSGDLGTVDEDATTALPGASRHDHPRRRERVPLGGGELPLDHARRAGRQVVGIPDPKLGELVGAFVRVRPGYEDMTEDDVRAFAIPRIARYKVPKRVFFVDDFPMTPSMKVQKFKLREMAEELVRAGK